MVADKGYSVCEERVGFTDFAKVAFTITTTDGKTVTIQADRYVHTQIIDLQTVFHGVNAARVHTPLSTAPAGLIPRSCLRLHSCGGNNSQAIVTDASGAEVFR